MIPSRQTASFSVTRQPNSGRGSPSDRLQHLCESLRDRRRLLGWQPYRDTRGVRVKDLLMDLGAGGLFFVQSAISKLPQEVETALLSTLLLEPDTICIFGVL
jgi:hypothetical protein